MNLLLKQSLFDAIDRDDLASFLKDFRSSPALIITSDCREDIFLKICATKKPQDYMREAINLSGPDLSAGRVTYYEIVKPMFEAVFRTGNAEALSFLLQSDSHQARKHICKLFPWPHIKRNNTEFLKALEKHIDQHTLYVLLQSGMEKHDKNAIELACFMLSTSSKHTQNTHQGLGLHVQRAVGIVRSLYDNDQLTYLWQCADPGTQKNLAKSVFLGFLWHNHEAEERRQQKIDIFPFWEGLNETALREAFFLAFCETNKEAGRGYFNAIHKGDVYKSVLGGYEPILMALPEDVRQNIFAELTKIELSHNLSMSDIMPTASAWVSKYDLLNNIKPTTNAAKSRAM